MKSAWGNESFSRALLVFCLGFFALIAQTLLFRDFFTVYEGNELGFGCFFSTWLIWVGLGALSARWITAISPDLAGHVPRLSLLYIPAYFLQNYLILKSRTLAGVQAYELFAFTQMLPVSFLANAPVSFVTGFLFTLACQWASQNQVLPVARVYMMESLGGFSGGIIVTILLANGFSSAGIFVATCFSLCCGMAMASAPSKKVWILPALCLLVLFLGLHRKWEQSGDRRAWSRLLPETACQGSFNTPQARYLYGSYRDQFNVLAWESVYESIPNVEHASEVVACSLPQKPDARNIVVIGSDGVSMAQRFLRLPGIESVSWLHPDPDYPTRLLNVLPADLTKELGRMKMPGVDVRKYFRQSTERVDLVLLNLPDATTLVLNRYFTREFMEQVKAHLVPGGVLGIRLSGGENFMGGELINLGASVVVTARSVFKNTALKSGDETWLMVSDGDGLSEDPAVLATRWSQIQNARSVYPPEGLSTLYIPDRIQFQKDKYRQVLDRMPAKELLNTDARPRAVLHSLLLIARHAGTPVWVTPAIHRFAVSGFQILLALILIYLSLRFVYRSKRTGIGSQSAVADVLFLIFSAGFLGMSLTLILMFHFQSAFGSLFLNIGLLSALFMLGLFLGSFLSDRILSVADLGEVGDRAHRVRLQRQCEPTWLFPLLLFLNAVLLASVYFMNAATSLALLILAFLLCGVFGGVYVPIAAARMKSADSSHLRAGALIESFDHVGGAVGGLLAGIVFLPVLGIQATLLLLGILLIANFLALAPGRWSNKRTSGDWFDRTALPAGYILFGLTLFLVVASELWRSAKAREGESDFVNCARSMAQDQKIQIRAGTDSDGSQFEYAIIQGEDFKPRGYIFETRNFAPPVSGYGGSISLAVQVDAQGVFIDFKPLIWSETPAYVRGLERWKKTLLRHNLFSGKLREEVDALTGATVSSEAILILLQHAGNGFYGQVIAGGSGDLLPAGRKPFQPAAMTLCVLIGIALLLRVRPSHLLRILFLLSVLLVLGVHFNVQFSMDQILSLLSGGIPEWSLSVPFLLIVAVPLLTLFFGNMYCGYLCPFGALQELISDMRPQFLSMNPDKRVWRWGRAIKYGLLFILLIAFAFTGRKEVSNADPLVTAFSPSMSNAVFYILCGIMILSFFFDRFWCRNFCPTGAFLSLLNAVRFLKRLLPNVVPGKCGYGVRQVTDLDCLVCDRCRAKIILEGAEPVEKVVTGVRQRWNNKLYLVLLIASLVWLAQDIFLTVKPPLDLSQITVGKFNQTTPPMRSVEMNRLEKLTEQGQLSDREAMYYRSLDETKD